MGAPFVQPSMISIIHCAYLGFQGKAKAEHTACNAQQQRTAHYAVQCIITQCRNGSQKQTWFPKLIFLDSVLVFYWNGRSHFDNTWGQSMLIYTSRHEYYLLSPRMWRFASNTFYDIHGILCANFIASYWHMLFSWHDSNKKPSS